MRRHAPRRAATAARSQIAESTKQAVDYKSESEVEVEESVRTSARISVTDRTQPRHVKQEPEWNVSIDFGTTFTTVAWYRRGTSTERIHTIDNFPGEKLHHQTHRQIPTELWYPKRNTHSSGHVKSRDVRIRFGNEVHRLAEGDEGGELREFYDDADRVSMMKLLLDNSEYAQASKKRLQDTLESIRAKGHIEKSEDVFFHFLREVFKAIKTRLGSDFTKDSTGTLSVQTAPHS